MDKQPVQTISDELNELINLTGSRLAGSAAERKGAEFMAEKFRKYGAASVDLETFPMMATEVKKQSLEVRINGKWQSIPVNLLSGGVPGTDGRIIEAEPVMFYSAVDYQRKDLSYLKGKAVIHFGTNYAPLANYQRLMAAEPAFILLADTRFPGKENRVNAILPHYVRQAGAVPSVSIALGEVWEWALQNGDMLRLCIDGGSFPRESVNVIATFPGSDPDAGVIYIGSHIDSQATSPGADDNASGMMFQLALARELAADKLRHTICYGAFGTEEQLSVGSTAYVKRHRDEIIRRGRFMINADSCGTLLGWDEVNCCAEKQVWETLRQIMAANGVYANVNLEPDPFTDLMPFNSCAVPGIWLARSNCLTGRFQHHSTLDTPEAISPEVLAVRARIAAELIRKIDCGELTVSPLDKETQEAVNASWQEFFGEEPLV
jgi:hypothetical protein